MESYTPDEVAALFSVVHPSISTYRRKLPIRALPMSSGEHVDLIQKDGSIIPVLYDDWWLALDSEGNPYPIENGVFEASYELVKE